MKLDFIVGCIVIIVDLATVVVYCPQAMQLERLMLRDGINAHQAKARMDSQMSIEQKKTLGHHIIDNSGDFINKARCNQHETKLKI